MRTMNGSHTSVDITLQHLPRPAGLCTAMSPCASPDGVGEQHVAAARSSGHRQAGAYAQLLLPQAARPRLGARQQVLPLHRGVPQQRVPASISTIAGSVTPRPTPVWTPAVGALCPQDVDVQQQMTASAGSSIRSAQVEVDALGHGSAQHRRLQAGVQSLDADALHRLPACSQIMMSAMSLHKGSTHLSSGIATSSHYISHLKNVCKSAARRFLDHQRLAVATLGRWRQWQWRFRSALRRLLPRGLHGGYGHQGVRSQQRHDAACTAAQSIRMHLRVLASYAALNVAAQRQLRTQYPPAAPDTPSTTASDAMLAVVYSRSSARRQVHHTAVRSTELVSCPAALLPSALACDLQHLCS